VASFCVARRFLRAKFDPQASGKKDDFSSTFSAYPALTYVKKKTPLEEGMNLF
jgi:hypothetical protein